MGKMFGALMGFVAGIVIGFLVALFLGGSGVSLPFAGAENILFVAIVIIFTAIGYTQSKK